MSLFFKMYRLKYTEEILFLLLFYVSSVRTVNSSQEIEGYPWGMLSDCPGSEIPLKISSESLKLLSITVHGLTGRRHYNYHEMDQLVKDPDINFTRKTVLFSIGYLDSPKLLVGRIIAPFYVDLNYNVLILDISKFSQKFYPIAIRYLRGAGVNAAEMLITLTKFGLDPKQLELVGVSLGAQMVSFVAKNFHRMTGVKVSRITALDSSGPCFRHLGPESRLDANDADFVDTIGTNIDGFGMAAPVGHVNFYVNGGEFQPGDILWMPCNVMCSHGRSYTIWLSALRHPRSFIAVKCDSVQQARMHQCFDRVPQDTNIMGLQVDKNNTGIFYLATDNNFPYYLGKKGLIKRNQFYSSHLEAKEDSSNAVFTFITRQLQRIADLL